MRRMIGIGGGDKEGHSAAAEKEMEPDLERKGIAGRKKGRRGTGILGALHERPG
jgi:hypothetical protein